MLLASVLAGFVPGLMLAATVGANPVPDPVYPGIMPRQTIIPGGRPCGQNNATNRRCWKNNWNVTTDYDLSYPPAFNNREVSLPCLTYTKANDT
jgi:hypothetical protein